jgi:hypothetical protein
MRAVFETLPTSTAVSKNSTTFLQTSTAGIILGFNSLFPEKIRAWTFLQSF